MLFFETSAKTSYNIEEVFSASAKEIAKKIDNNFYDLTSDMCGVKQGMTNTTGLLKLDKDFNKGEDKKKSGCC